MICHSCSIRVLARRAKRFVLSKPEQSSVPLLPNYARLHSLSNSVYKKINNEKIKLGFVGWNGLEKRNRTI